MLSLWTWQDKPVKKVETLEMEIKVDTSEALRNLDELADKITGIPAWALGDVPAFWDTARYQKD